MSLDHGTRMLRSIRRIIRAVDINSKLLQQQADITTPQLICLAAVAHEQNLTLKALSKNVDLSPSTTTGSQRFRHPDPQPERPPPGSDCHYSCREKYTGIITLSITTGDAGTLRTSG